MAPRARDTTDRLRILLVEDDDVDAERVKRCLLRAGGSRFELRRVGYLAAALQSLQEEHCDVVLLDLGLPDASWNRSVESIRATAHGVPIIVLTGLDDEARADELLESGVQDYLVKAHLDYSLLARSLRYSMDRQALLRKLEDERDELKSFVAQVRSGEVDTIVGDGAESRIIRLLDATVVEENDRLMQEISRSNQELETANKELRRLDQMKSDFIAVASHELRTPLTAIKNAIGLLVTGTTGALNENQGRFLTIAARGIDRLTDLINDLLDLTKIEAGKVAFRLSEADLRPVIQQTCATFQPQAEVGSLTLDVNCSSTLPVTSTPFE